MDEPLLSPDVARRVAAATEGAPCPITDDPARAEGAIVLVERIDRPALSRLLDAGAAGVVLIDEIERCLPAAVGAVAAGLTVVPAGARRALQRPVLTARQQEILSLLVLGLPNATIAARLFVSESTIKTHLSAIFEKLGVRSRKEAIDLVLDPASGLGTGILSVSSSEPRRPGGYRSPGIRS